MTQNATERIAELEARLSEAEETLQAIRNGEVDAVVVTSRAGQQIYTLENADRPYRVLIEQMQEGAVSLSDDGTILYCNQCFAGLVDAPRERLIGGSLLALFAAGEGDAFRLLLAGAPGAGASGEFSLRSGGGSEVPVNISLAELIADDGHPRVICGVVTDLTQNRRRSFELRAVNQALAREIDERRRAEAFLQLALDAADMGSWDLDLATGVAGHSLRHDQIFGHPEALPVWRLDDALNQFLEEDRDAVRAAFAQAETSDGLDFERRIRRAGDGATRWLHVRARTHYDNGQPARIAGVVADVTDARATEEQLRQAQKMEAVGQLTGGIAHDFNNLLMIIGGSLDMLARRLPPDDKSMRFLDAARKGVARGAKLNQQLLAFSRRQDLRAEVVCVDELIPGFEHLLDRALGETVSLRVERSSQPWFCRTDPHQLETAILNLAINARDAMPGGGTLSLSTANRTVSEAVAAAVGASAGDYVVVTLSDTGSGMPPDVLSRAFEPFFTTKAIGHGTGLGLSQVYGFVKQSDGFVTIDSEPGQGTRVAIHLPRAQPARAARPQAAATADFSGYGVVLVVEDDTDVRATTSGMLRDLGYAVREAETGHAALAMLNAGAAIDLVFSDVIMPDGMSGIELARELRKWHPGLPVLLTSGYTAQRLIPEALADGWHLLRKPYTLAELSQAIGKAMHWP